MAEVAGAENVLEMLTEPIAEVTPATILEAAPDIIVDASGEGGTGFASGIHRSSTSRVDSIPAVTTIPLSGAELLRVAIHLRRAFYPDERRFAAPSAEP